MFSSEILPRYLPKTIAVMKRVKAQIAKMMKNLPYQPGFFLCLLRKARLLAELTRFMEAYLSVTRSVSLPSSLNSNTSVLLYSSTMLLNSEPMMAFPKSSKL